jgi:hypothetical protein
VDALGLLRLARARSGAPARLGIGFERAKPVPEPAQRQRAGLTGDPAAADMAGLSRSSGTRWLGIGEASTEAAASFQTEQSGIFLRAATNEPTRTSRSFGDLQNS